MSWQYCACNKLSLFFKPRFNPEIFRLWDVTSDAGTLDLVILHLL